MSLLPVSRLASRDVVLLCGFCAIVFGISLVGGRVLTVHEARLPQTSREMLADQDWLVPKSGGRPWLERPPLPHWCSVAISAVVGRTDAAWIYRIAPALAGMLCVVLTAWMTAILYGRAEGLLAGLALATSFQFLRYAWLAEEEVFLAAIVAACLAVFVQLEFGSSPSSKPESTGFLGPRPAGVLVFFVLLGASNWIKGLFFAAALVVATVGSFLLLSRERARIWRYVWCWGWLAFAAIGLAWSTAIALRFPEVLDIMSFDVASRLDGRRHTSPPWYYLLAVIWEVIPWTLPAIVGLAGTWRAAWRERTGRERFLWCAAIVPLALLSIPSGKHHHYLVPVLPAWAMLSAVGLVRIWKWNESHRPTWTSLLAGLACATAGSIACIALADKIPGPPWLPFALATLFPLGIVSLHLAMLQRSPVVASSIVFSLVAMSYLFGHVYTSRYLDRYRPDTEFLASLDARVPPGEPIYLDATNAGLEPFRQLFYVGERAKLLHNLTFLRDDRITSPVVYVVARDGAEPLLAELGTPELVAKSPIASRAYDGTQHWTLFRLTFDPKLTRYAGDVQISAVQAFDKIRGPYLGTPLEPERVTAVEAGDGRMWK